MLGVATYKLGLCLLYRMHLICKPGMKSFTIQVERKLYRSVHKCTTMSVQYSFQKPLFLVGSSPFSVCVQCIQEVHRKLSGKN